MKTSVQDRSKQIYTAEAFIDPADNIPAILNNSEWHGICVAVVLTVSDSAHRLITSQYSARPEQAYDIDDHKAESEHIV